jgi:hypothetical protein
MVRCLSFSQKNSRCEFFCEKDRESSALPEPALSVVEWGDISRQTRDRLLHVSIGRFAVFAHFVLFVVQTPTAYVLSMTRLMRSMTRHITSPAAASPAGSTTT